jgi:hypothetical protein
VLIAAPLFVAMPSVRNALGSNLFVTWTTPQFYTGTITQYVVNAYARNNLSSVPAQTAFPGNVLQGNFNLPVAVFISCVRAYI